MRMIVFSLLLLLPLISSAAENADAVANLGFTCDDKKCVFSLQIPQTAVEFVDVDLLQREIASLQSNLTELQSSEKVIQDDEGIFNTDFSGAYDEVSQQLDDMFAIASELNETCSINLEKAMDKENTANLLYSALDCMVKGKAPKTCYSGPTIAPPTQAPDSTDDDTDKPVTDSGETVEPFTGSTTTEEPFTGSTTTQAPFTGSTTTESPFTGSTTEPNTPEQYTGESSTSSTTVLADATSPSSTTEEQTTTEAPTTTTS